MSEVQRQIHRRVASSASAAVVSDAVRVGGNLFDVQVEAPASLVTVQISSDALAWFTATELGGTALASIGDSYSAGIQEGARWARISVATDGGGPRNFDAAFIVHKQSD